MACSLCLPCEFYCWSTYGLSHSATQFEYIINQGISPTLLYPVPSPEKDWLLSKVIHSLRDYYPLWQVKKSFSCFPFFAVSIVLFLPLHPAGLSVYGFSFPLFDFSRFATYTPTTPPVALYNSILHPITIGIRICQGPPWSWWWIEWSQRRTLHLVGFLFDLFRRNLWRVGIVSNSTFLLIPFVVDPLQPSSVNAFFRVNQEPPDTPSISTSNDLEWTRQAREFKIGSIGFADSMGILLASLIAMPTEIQLCKVQVKRGKFLCKGL